MQKRIIHIIAVLIFLYSSELKSQNTDITIQGANINISSGTSLIIPNNINISGASDYILNNGNLYTGGNFTNNGNGLSATGTGTVIFNGAGTQNINGSNSTTFYDVTKSTNSSVIISLDEFINHNLTLTTGFFDLNGYNLTLNGAFSGSGTFLGSLSSGLIIGGAAGTISFDPAGTNSYLKILTLNSSASATIGNTLNIAAGDSLTGYGTVTANASSDLDANNNLTLKSGANGTARVDISTGAIRNNVTIERYIPPRRAWRFLSVPFYSSTQTINEAWQEGNVNPDLNCANNQYAPAGYGTEITYNANGTNGFDPNITTNPSIEIWAGTAWTYPGTTYIPIKSAPAYSLFVRGDRTICLSYGIYAIPTPTVLRIKGVLNERGIANNSFQQNYTGSPGDFMFVANPYASSIDLYNGSNGILSASRIGTSGIDNDKFWVWNPKRYGVYGVGGYVAFSNGVQAPVDTSYTYNAGTIIQSGQAFMVQLSTVSTNASVQFLQNDKVPNERNVFGKKAPRVIPVIAANVLIDAGNSYELADGIAAAFGNKFSATVDANDADKLWNINENMSLVRNTKTLAIEFRPVPVLTDTLFFRLYLKQLQPYSLQLFTQNFESMPLMRAWIVDKYFNTKTEINLNDTSLYNFTPNTDTNSYRNRFMLVFNRQFETNPVPVTKAINQNDPNITGIANSLANTPGISIFPNPVKPGSVVTLKLNNIADGTYQAELMDVNGKKIKVSKIIHDKGSNSYSVLVPSTIAAGIYNLRLIDGDGNILATEKLVVGK